MVRKFISEFLGTTVFLFTGLYAAAVFDQSYINDSVAAGVALIAMIYLFRHVSGGMFNPALSLSALLDRRIRVKDFIVDVIAEAAGGFFAGWLMIHCAGVYTYSIDSMVRDNVGLTILREAVFTLIFAAVFLTVTSSHENEYTNAISGIIIGLTYSVLATIGMGFSGAGMNPAEAAEYYAANPNAVTPGMVVALIAGPLIGAAIAWLLYRLVIRPADSSKEGAAPKAEPKKRVHKEKPAKAKKHLKTKSAKKAEKAEEEVKPAEEPDLSESETPAAKSEEPSPLMLDDDTESDIDQEHPEEPMHSDGGDSIWF